MIIMFYERLINLFYKIKTRFFYSIFFGSIGKRSCIKNPLFIKNVHNVFIGDNFFIRDHARIEVVGDGRISFGDSVSIEQGFHITSGYEIIIGNSVVISFGAMITDIDHNYKEINLRVLEQRNILRKTEIGDFCFIGAGVKIQAGTILGKQCVVGANAVIRGSFPDYCVIVGIPGRIIKRFNIKTNQWEKTNERGEFINDLQ
ncbi:acyltransferase [Pectobacterium versatile]|uniref:acyltransferase n=1 Tax=Pectobacterium versatile TaxID=2488639 RepID=UPI0020BEBCAA|nr:acyltransferase [Pectobacterium versatile]